MTSTAPAYLVGRANVVASIAHVTKENPSPLFMIVSPWIEWPSDKNILYRIYANCQGLKYK